jgi:hypothetical protein
VTVCLALAASAAFFVFVTWPKIKGSGTATGSLALEARSPSSMPPVAAKGAPGGNSPAPADLVSLENVPTSPRPATRARHPGAPSAGSPPVDAAEKPASPTEAADPENRTTVPATPEPVLPRSPETAAAAIFDLLDGGDPRALDAVLAEAADVSEPTRERLIRLIHAAGFRLDHSVAARSVGEIGGRARWEFQITSDKKNALSALTLDLVRDDDRIWKIGAIGLPERLIAFADTLDPVPPRPTVPQPGPGGEPRADARGAPDLGDEGNPLHPGQVASSPAATPAGREPLVLMDAGPKAGRDPLAVVDAFLGAAFDRDIEKVRPLVNAASVSDEKLAALLIVMEDGAFAPRGRRPVVTTAVDDESAWLIARLVAESGSGEVTEFGLQLARGADGSWQITDITFSELISEVAESLGAGDIGYAPIVTDPGGGESLALYFPFDETAVHPRVARQLTIIAEVLRADPSKKVKIDGHADARGTTRYNRRLSSDRATNVREALIGLGVAPEQIVTASFGESRPAEPNRLPDGSDNPTGRMRNRRAEVYLDF